MNISNLKWAYTKYEIRNIKGASKDEKYFLDISSKIPLIYCKGEINKPYWRKEPNINDDVIRNHFGCSESLEHYNTKIEFTKRKILCYGVNILKGSFAKSEYHIRQINKTIDVIYFDENKNPLLGIEVYHKNKKTSEDINKFNKLNFPIYEYNYNTREGKFISFGGSEIAEVESIKRQINNVNGLINFNKGRINGARRHIQILQKRVDLENKKYFKETEEIQEIEREFEIRRNK